MKKQSKGKTGGGVIAAIGLLILSKIKWVLALLKFTKFGGTFISMVISLGIYIAVFGWWFAVALIYLMFVHEMGHLVAAKQKGIKTSPAIFVPFLGAAIGMKEKPKNAATEAYLAYGGPLAGLVSILPAIILFNFTHQPFWALVILLGGFINLINLVPISPLDGGRIVGVLSPHLWLLGLVAIVVITYFYPSPLLFLIIILGLFSWWHRIREDFMIKTIQANISVKTELMVIIEKYRKDLFYTYYDEAENEGPPVNDVMEYYVRRELNNYKREVVEKLRPMKSWFFPFFEDKAKLKKRRFVMLLQGLDSWIERLDRIAVPSDLDDLFNADQRAIRDLEKEIDKINKYYDAPTKTRVIVFLAYIALAAVLGFLYFYGEHLLNSFYFLDQMESPSLFQ